MEIPKNGPIRDAFLMGCDSVLNDIWDAISELEETRSDTGHGRAQKYILRALIEKMDMAEDYRTRGSRCRLTER